MNKTTYHIVNIAAICLCFTLAMALRAHDKIKGKKK